MGIEHAKYSPLVLLHEALQLCRTAHEHGAREVTIALPEQFHPALYFNDFNPLLMSLFKASGATKIYFYDKTHTGTLDETTSKAIIPIILSQRSDAEKYQINRSDMLEYLHAPNPNNKLSLDDQVMHFTRKNYLNQTSTLHL